MQVACYNCVSRFLVALDGKTMISSARYATTSNKHVVGERNSTGPDDVSLTGH